MQACDLKQDSLNDSPFVLIENSIHQDESNSDYAHLPSWGFEVGLPGKTISLTLIATQDEAILSDMVPVAHKICDMINQLGVENITEKGEEISCQKGCASCCSYMVSISSAEAFYIQKYVLVLPAEKRKSIQHSFLKAARKVAANKVPPVIETDATDSECLKAISNWYQKMSVKCPFIKDNACLEYQARPLVCREHLVTSPPKACNPLSSLLANVVELPVSTAEALMHISNQAESTLDEAVILPLAMVWCDSNVKRGEKKYPATQLAQYLIEAISAHTPAMA